MPTDDQQVLVAGQAPAPAQFTIPGNGQIRPKTIFASYDGAAAGTPYLPALKLISDGGKLVGIFKTCAPVAAGGSAAVTWFPWLDACCGQAASAAGSGSVSSVTSPQGTLSVANPSGPIVNVDMPVTGVTAGTYGDGAHVSEITVDAEGRITNATVVPISGVGTFTTLFDQTLGGSAASIDTGAGGVAAGYSTLMVSVLARADGAFFSGNFGLIFNNDSAANYQYIWTDNSNGASASHISTAQTSVKTMEGPGANIGAGIFGVSHVTIPGYSQTTANKAITALGGFAETSGHSELVHTVGTWNNTAAITRIALICGIGNLVAGSRLVIYGLP